MWHSLGLITVTTSGTPVRVTVNQSVPAQRIGCQTLFIQQWPGNSTVGYICDRATANITTGVGVLAVIPKPTTDGAGDAISLPNGAVTIPNAPSALNAADFYLDAGADGTSFLVSYVS